MNILLIKMNSPADEIIPPISLGYLASGVLDRHNVTILDNLKEKLSLEEISEKVRKFDIAGITLFTKDLSLCKKYLKTIKSANPNCITVLGGPHPSALPEETMFFFKDLVNYLLVGESETGFPKLINFIESGKPELNEIEGLVYIKDGSIKKNTPICIENIDNFKIAWQLIPPDSYPQAPHGAFFKQFPIAPIITSRGCPFHCTFCGGHIISGRKIRQRSVDNVIEEIGLLYKNYGVREIHIEDDNFTFRKDYVLEFCSKLKSNFPDITWTCPNGVRIDTLDEEMISAMKSSGCYALSIGIESGSNRILKLMKKSLTVEKTKEKVEMLKKFDIDINAFFILGYPGEKKEDIEKTINLALSLPLKRASFANFQPLPGTESYYNLIKEGLLKIDHWEKFSPSLQSTIWSAPGFTVRELAWYRRKALLKFYLRPRIMWHFLKGIRNLQHFYYIFKRAYRWLTYTGEKTL
ncbi:MAG: B12-binding domain-containing radical SAM protein [Proteobacteria bacterium]|nr:B12-binding domain-containing radical SAM protein [Pseudomonadota bacterium]